MSVPVKNAWSDRDGPTARIVITTLAPPITHRHANRMDFILFLLMFVGLCGWLDNWATT